jgi:hypothetical protein
MHIGGVPLTGAPPVFVWSLKNTNSPAVRSW